MPACTCTDRTLRSIEVAYRIQPEIHRRSPDYHEKACARYCPCLTHRRENLASGVTRSLVFDGHVSSCPWYVEPPPPPTREERVRASLTRRTTSGRSVAYVTNELLIELMVMQDRTNELLERLLADVDDDE